MDIPIEGIEYLFAVAAQKVGFDHQTLRLYGVDTSIEVAGRNLYVDSKNNDWIIFPEDFEWEVKFKLDEFEWVERYKSFSVRMNEMKFSGDCRMLQHDILLTRLTHGEDVPDQGRVN